MYHALTVQIGRSVYLCTVVQIPKQSLCLRKMGYAGRHETGRPGSPLVSVWSLHTKYIRTFAVQDAHQHVLLHGQVSTFDQVCMPGALETSVL